MRRAFSTFLVLFFGLGPLASTLNASDDARLPICCRRTGSHHCSMSGEVLAQIATASQDSIPVLAAPAHCPLYPGLVPATISPIHVLAAASTVSFAIQAQALSPRSLQLAAISSAARTHSVRGPPALTL